MTRAIASLCIATAILLALAPAAGARRVALRSATGITPLVTPTSRIRKTERVVKLSARSVSGAKIEAFVQVFCFNKNLRLYRKTKTVTGVGRVTTKVRRPRGKGLSCTADANVRVTSRPAPVSGPVPPIRLSAALYATRR